MDIRQETDLGMVARMDSVVGGTPGEHQPDPVEIAKWLADHGRVAELVIASTLDRMGSSQPGELERLLVEVARRMVCRIDFEPSRAWPLAKSYQGAGASWDAWHLAVVVRRMVIRELLPTRRVAS